MTAKTPGVRKRKPKVSLEEGDLLKLKYHHEKWAAHVNAALATNDFDTILRVLGTIARARGMSKIAERTGLNRENLYRSYSVGSSPSFENAIKLLKALGLRFTVRQIHTD